MAVKKIIAVLLMLMLFLPVQATEEQSGVEPQNSQEQELLSPVDAQDSILDSSKAGEENLLPAETPSATEFKIPSGKKKLAKKFEDPKFVYKVTRRSVWLCMPSRASNVKHSAVYPRELIEPIILSSCPQGGTVLDPFGGSGTTAVVAEYLGRNAINCELNDNGKELYFERKAEIERQMKNNNQIKEKDVVAVVKQKLEVKTAKGRTLW